MKTLEVRTRRAWRTWLQRHHDSVSEIWLVFYKRHTGVTYVSYDEAVEEALCFGWIDSLAKRLDDDRWAQKFTPRRPDSRWSTINRRRYEDLKARGLVAAPGVARAPTDRSGDAPRPSVSVISPDIERGLRANARAWESFQQLAPSHRRQYLGWIGSAKREETKTRRLREAISLLAAGKKLGLK